MDWDFGDWLADAGLRRYPGDGELLLFQGTLLETVGWRDTKRTTTASHGALGRAEAALKAAVAAAQDPLEAHIRLAHVLSLVGRREEARQILEGVLVASPDGALRYMAELFLGGALEDEGFLARASAAYRRAIVVHPDSQAARVALGHALFSSGDVSAARRVLEEGLALAGRREPDSFWLYPWGHSAEAQGRLEALEEEAGQCCR